MSNVVKYFHSGMLGAPVLNNAAGTLIAVLDGCLVNGWGSQVATSVVIAGGVATVTLPSSHPFEVDTVALISGASPAGLNGEFKLTAIGANTVSFPTALPDQTATGTITVKLAPLGWAKVFSGTNLAAYRTNDVESVRAFLRVDDTNANEARVVAYESMSDVSSGTNPFPSPSQFVGGGYWPKANNASVPRAWTVIGDGKTFYIHMHSANTAIGVAGNVWSFGEFNPVRSGDAYRTVLFPGLNVNMSTSTSATTATQVVEYNAPTGTGAYLQRSFSGLGGSQACVHTAEANTGSTQGVSGYAGWYNYPNAPDNSLLTSRKIIGESGYLRGYLRGLQVSQQVCHTAFNWLDKIAGQGVLAGRKLLAVKCGSTGGTASFGVVFFDVTGPWE